MTSLVSKDADGGIATNWQNIHWILKKGWSILHVTQELWYDLTPNFDHVKTIFVIILSAHIALFYLSPNGEQWFAIMEGHCFNLNEEFTFPTNSWKDSSGTNEGVYEQCQGAPISWRPSMKNNPTRLVTISGWRPSWINITVNCSAQSQKDLIHKKWEGMAFNEKEFRALMRPYTIMVAEQQWATSSATADNLLMSFQINLTTPNQQPLTKALMNVWSYFFAIEINHMGSRASQKN